MEPNAVQHSLQTANSTIQAKTIDGVNAHLENHLSPAMTEDNVRECATAAPDDTLKEVYHVARPVLTFLEGALFLAPGWHKALKGLVAALDVITAQPAEQEANKDEENKMPL